MSFNEQVAKTIPKNAPGWAKKKPLAFVTTVISTLAGVVAIAAWLGFRPPQVLAADEAFVTHQQFNLLLVNLVESVEELEDNFDDVKDKITRLEMLAELMSRPSGGSSAMSAPAPVVEELVGPPEPDARVRLNAAKEKIEMLQLEQRTR